MAQRCCVLGPHYLHAALRHILVEGLPADAKLPGDLCLADARCNARAQLHDGRGGEGLFAALIGAPLLGQRDAFALRGYA